MLYVYKPGDQHFNKLTDKHFNYTDYFIVTFLNPTYDAGIMLDAFKNLVYSKLCWSNRPEPSLRELEGNIDEVNTGSTFVELHLFSFECLTVKPCMSNYIRKTITTLRTSLQAYTKWYNKKTKAIMVAITGRHYCCDGI